MFFRRKKSHPRPRRNRKVSNAVRREFRHTMVIVGILHAVAIVALGMTMNGSPDGEENSSPDVVWLETAPMPPTQTALGPDPGAAPEQSLEDQPPVPEELPIKQQDFTLPPDVPVLPAEPVLEEEEPLEEIEEPEPERVSDRRMPETIPDNTPDKEPDQEKLLAMRELLKNATQPARMPEPQPVLPPSPQPSHNEASAPIVETVEPAPRADEREEQESGESAEELENKAELIGDKNPEKTPDKKAESTDLQKPDAQDQTPPQPKPEHEPEPPGPRLVAERSASDPPRAEPVTGMRTQPRPERGKPRLPWQKITVPQELSLRELQTYQREIHDRFARQWRRPYHLAYAGRELVSTVRFRINRNGRISNVALVRGSGNKEMDHSVLQAAKTVRAVSPIPKNAQSDYYDIMVEFALTPVKRD